MTRIAAQAGAPSRPVSERDLQRDVVAQARSLGWGVTQSQAKQLAADAIAYGVEPPPLDGLIFHPRYSLGSEPGWPDLTLIRRRDRRMIYAELKTEKGIVSPRQAEVLELLRLFATPEPPICGEGAHLSYVERSIDGKPEPRLACCPPWIQVLVWRPSDMPTILEVLR